MSDNSNKKADSNAMEAGLLAGRSLVDGRLIYPMPVGEAAAGYEPVVLARHGRLWSWALKRHRPRGQGQQIAPYPSFPVGYVELDSGMMVEGRLVVDDQSILRQGLELELTIEAETDLDADGRAPREGGAIFTYVFRPNAR